MVESYEAATKQFLDAVATVGPEELDKAPAGEWTPRQIIHHQAHADAYCLTRIIQVVSEPGTTVRSFSEEALVSSKILSYESAPIEPSISLLIALRSETLRIIKLCTDADLSLACVHSELGEFTLQDMII